MKRHIAIIGLVIAAVLLINSCGSTETAPAEKVYLEGSEIDAALSDGDSYKGKWIVITGKVFNIDKDGEDYAIQAWSDAENSDRQFIVYVAGDKVESVNNDDYIKVDGEISGTFKGENAFGGVISAPLINAESIEVGGYDDLYAPAESTKEVGDTKDQHGVKVTLDRIEYAKDEARVYVTVKNESGYNASIYTYDAKAVQDGKQFNHEDNWNAGDATDIGEVLDGGSKGGIIRFKGLDPEKPVRIQFSAYSDNWDIQMEDFVFEVE